MEARKKLFTLPPFPGGRTLILVGLLGIRARGILGTPYSEVSARLEQLSGNGSGQFGPNLASALSRLQALIILFIGGAIVAAALTNSSGGWSKIQGEGEILLLGLVSFGQSVKLKD